MLGLDFSVMTPEAFKVLADGMLTTLQVTAFALVVGLVWGTLLAMMRLSRFWFLSWPATLYINFFRAIPLAMILLGFYLLVPQLLKNLFHMAPATDTRMMSALLGFALFEAAYYAEIMRAGIQSVPRGQLAVSYALGMRTSQAMRLVILPQALRNMLPLLLTQLIVLFQDTSLVYIISLADFFTSAEGIGERDGRIEEMMLIAGAVYFFFSFSASMLVRRLSGGVKA